MAYWLSNGRLTDDFTWPPNGVMRLYGRLS